MDRMIRTAGAVALLAVTAPALAAEEIRAIDPAAAGRFDDLAVLTDRELHGRLDGLGVTLIGYRALRDAQRAAR